MRPQSWSLIDILARIRQLGKKPARTAGGTTDDLAEPHRNSLLIALAVALPYAAAAFWRIVYTPYPLATDDTGAALLDATLVGIACMAACYWLRRLTNPRLRPRRASGRQRRRLTIAVFEAAFLALATAIAPLSWGVRFANGEVQAILVTSVVGGVLVWLALGFRIDGPSPREVPAP